MNIEARIAAALAKPITHEVITTYADGSEKRHGTRCAKSAEAYAIGERRKIGRELIDRATGKAVEVLTVEVSEI